MYEISKVFLSVFRRKRQRETLESLLEKEKAYAPWEKEYKKRLGFELYEITGKELESDKVVYNMWREWLKVKAALCLHQNLNNDLLCKQ